MLDRASDAPRVVERVPGMYVSQKLLSVVSVARLPETPLEPKISVLGRRGIQRDPYWTGELTIGSFPLRIVGTCRARTVRAVRPVGGDSRVAGQPRDGFPRLGGAKARFERSEIGLLRRRSGAEGIS